MRMKKLPWDFRSYGQRWDWTDAGDRFSAAAKRAALKKTPHGLLTASTYLTDGPTALGSLPAGSPSTFKYSITSDGTQRFSSSS
jgi:hypothetical protein